MIGTLTVPRIVTDRNLSTASHHVTWSRNHSIAAIKKAARHCTAAADARRLKSTA